MKPYCALNSYNRSDRESALQIYRELLIESLTAWVDGERLKPGAPVNPTIRRQVQESGYFPTVISKHSIDSEPQLSLIPVPHDDTRPTSHEDLAEPVFEFECSEHWLFRTLKGGCARSAAAEAPSSAATPGRRRGRSSSTRRSKEYEWEVCSPDPISRKSYRLPKEALKKKAHERSIMLSDTVLESRIEKDRRVSKFFYHLGKGLWKSVPVVGPVVEELVYEQFHDKLTDRVSQLSDDDVQRIADAIPSMDFEKIGALTDASDRMQAFAVREFSAVLSSLAEMQTDAEDHFDSIEAKLDSIPTILALVDDVRSALSASADQRVALDRIERRRKQWIERISSSQRMLLNKLPGKFTSVDDLWPLCQTLIPSCAYKEFRFRLHELEWLSLVERRRREHTWLYRRTSDGRRAFNEPF